MVAGAHDQDESGHIRFYDTTRLSRLSDVFCDDCGLLLESCLCGIRSCVAYTALLSFNRTSLSCQFYQIPFRSYFRSIFYYVYNKAEEIQPVTVETEEGVAIEEVIRDVVNKGGGLALQSSLSVLHGCSGQSRLSDFFGDKAL